MIKLVIAAIPNALNCIVNVLPPEFHAAAAAIVSTAIILYWSTTAEILSCPLKDYNGRIP